MILTKNHWQIISNALSDRIEKLDKMIEENKSDKLLKKVLIEMKTEVHEIWNSILTDKDKM